MSYTVSVCIDLLLRCGLECDCYVCYYIIDEFIYDLLMPRLEAVLEAKDGGMEAAV